MTTIAWDGKTLAGDGYEVQGAIISFNRAIKVRKHVNALTVLSGFAGESQDGGIFRECIEAANVFSTIAGFIKKLREYTDKQKFTDPFCGVIIIREDGEAVNKIFELEHKGFAAEYSDKPTAWGSGMDAASGFLACGKTAVEAVQYAATRNIYTGGIVTGVSFE